MKEIDTDILIVGSGLVGLVTAHCLSALKYNVILVDKKKFTNSVEVLKDTRTVAVSEGSKQFLDSLFLWKELKKHAEPIKKIKVFDKTPLNKIFFESTEREKKLGYVVENSKFSKILRDKLAKFKNLKTFYGSEVLKINTNKSSSKTFLNNLTINSKLIIAADGKNSHIRKIIGNKVFKKNYSESALVLNFFHEKSLNSTAYEIFYKTGPLAILPMIPIKSFFQSSIIWSNKNSFVKKLISCDNKFISHIVEERVGEILGQITQINTKQSFPLSAHINDSFFNKRLVYIGDSAHSIHPIAGQGWNLGIKDVKSLNHVFKQYEEKRSEIGDEFFCSNYNNLTYKNAFQLYQITDKLNLHFKDGSYFNRLINNQGFKIIEKIPGLKNSITRYAMGV
jgi:2-octaprenyl-6-methoxyphenol hydroxylase